MLHGISGVITYIEVSRRPQQAMTYDTMMLNRVLELRVLDSRELALLINEPCIK